MQVFSNQLFRFIVLGSLSAALSACQPTETLPQVLTDEQVATLMADFATADAVVNPLSGYGRDSTVHAFYTQIFEKNGTTLEMYEANLAVLSKDISRMERIIKRAAQLLEDKKKQIPPAAAKDSVNTPAPKQ